MSPRTPCLALALAALAPAPARAQTLTPPYDAIYSMAALGTVPGVPTFAPSIGGYAGVAFKYDDPDTLVIATYYRSFGGGALYSVPLTRDGDDHITGFAGPATEIARTSKSIWAAPAYGPSDLLWSAGSKDLEQFKPGSATPDKVAPIGPPSFPSLAMAFVPLGFPGGGSMKRTDTTFAFHDVTLIPDGNGTYDVGPIVNTTFLNDQVHGIAYVPPASPYFRDNNAVLLVETNTYGRSSIKGYTIDGGGNPVGAGRQFITGFDSGGAGRAGILGPAFDPKTGDLLFCTPVAGPTVMIVRGFGTCTGNLTVPSSCGGGSINVSAALCRSGGRVRTISVTGAQPSSAGAMVFGLISAAIPVPGSGILGVIPLAIAPYTTSSQGSSAGFTLGVRRAWAGQVGFIQPATLTSCVPSGLSLGTTAFIGFH